MCELHFFLLHPQSYRRSSSSCSLLTYDVSEGRACGAQMSFHFLTSLSFNLSLRKCYHLLVDSKQTHAKTKTNSTTTTTSLYTTLHFLANGSRRSSSEKPKPRTDRRRRRRPEVTWAEWYDRVSGNVQAPGITGWGGGGAGSIVFHCWSYHFLLFQKKIHRTFEVK